jgi:hypothetical protein
MKIQADGWLGPLTGHRVGLWVSNRYHIDAAAFGAWRRRWYLWIEIKDRPYYKDPLYLAVGVQWSGPMWGGDAQPAYLSLFFGIFDVVVEFYPRKIRAHYGLLGALKAVRIDDEE